jgi:hypothetical protein
MGEGGHVAGIWIADIRDLIGQTEIRGWFYDRDSINTVVLLTGSARNVLDALTPGNNAGQSLFEIMTIIPSDTLRATPYMCPPPFSPSPTVSSHPYPLFLCASRIPSLEFCSYLFIGYIHHDFHSFTLHYDE